MRGMQSIPRTTLAGMLGVVLAVAPNSGSGQDLPRVIMQTDLGAIEIEIDTVRAQSLGTPTLKHISRRLIWHVCSTTTMGTVIMRTRDYVVLPARARSNPMIRG